MAWKWYQMWRGLNMAKEVHAPVHGAWGYQATPNTESDAEYEKKQGERYETQG